MFCQTCAASYVPIPTQQLFNPVRVCQSCYNALMSDVSAHAADSDNNETTDQKAKSSLCCDHDDEHGLVCSSSPLDIPCRNSNGSQPRGSNSSRTRGDDSRSGGSPAILPITSQSPTPKANSNPANNSSCSLSYKTCSQESINSSGSKHVDDQRMVGPAAKIF